MPKFILLILSMLFILPKKMLKFSRKLKKVLLNLRRKNHISGSLNEVLATH